MRKHERTNPAPNWIKNLALLAVTLSLTTVAAEFGLRAFFADITTTHFTSTYWGRRWKATQVRQNHLRFREREFAMQKPPGIYRIAVLGDSFTFGQGISEADRFSNRLEVALNDSDRAFEVLNFGRRGAETVDQIRMLEDTVFSVEPDFILLQWYINDVEGKDKSMRPAARPLIPSEELATILHKGSVLYFMLDEQWTAMQVDLGWTASYTEYLRARFGDPGGLDSRAAASAFSTLIALCRERSVPLGIVLFPHMRGIAMPTYPFDFLHERVLAQCAREGVDCLDLRAVMAHASRRGPLDVNRFDSHPNARANRIAAEEILRRFGPVWKPSPPGQLTFALVPGTFR
jgi:hypothetical protein